MDMTEEPTGGAGAEDPGPDPDVVHASGFPGWGPPTLCGEPGKTPQGCGEIGCEKCCEILCSDGGIAKRCQELDDEIGPPVRQTNSPDEACW